MVVLTFVRKAKRKRRKRKKRRRRRMARVTHVNVHQDSNFNLMAKPAKKYILVTGRTMEDVLKFARRLNIKRLVNVNLDSD